MKKFLYFLPAFLIIIALSYCSTPSPANRIGVKRKVFDTIRIVPKVEAISFQKELAGKWNVLTMRRQQKAELEHLNGVQLTFSEASNQFSGKAPCNNINGTIQLNGYSIRFQNIASTKMACEQLEQETAMLGLLESRISAFTITGNKLLLRDGISNIVFECERSNEPR